MQKKLLNQPRRIKQQGFTLIELLIVVAIIGILAAVGVPQYGNYLDRSERAACVSELNSFRSLALSSSINEDDIDFEFQSCALDDDDIDPLATVFADTGAAPGSYGTITTQNRAQEVYVTDSGRISISEDDAPSGD